MPGTLNLLHKGETGQSMGTMREIMIKDKGGNIETRCQGNWQQVGNMAEQNLSKETEKVKLNML